MNNFPEYYREGLGGQQTFNFIPVHDVDEIPLIFGLTQDEPVVLKTGKSWYTGNAIPGTLQLYEEDSGNGRYQYKLSGSMSGTDTAIIELFDYMSRRKFILDTTDRNGNRRLIGTISFGMSFLWKRDSKTDPSSRNDFLFEFSGELSKPAPIYDPA